MSFLYEIKNSWKLLNSDIMALALRSIRMKKKTFGKASIIAVCIEVVNWRWSWQPWLVNAIDCVGFPLRWICKLNTKRWLNTRRYLEILYEQKQ